LAVHLLKAKKPASQSGNRPALYEKEKKILGLNICNSFGLLKFRSEYTSSHNV